MSHILYHHDHKRRYKHRSKIKNILDENREKEVNSKMEITKQERYSQQIGMSNTKAEEWRKHQAKTLQTNILKKIAYRIKWMPLLSKTEHRQIPTIHYEYVSNQMKEDTLHYKIEYIREGSQNITNKNTTRKFQEDKSIYEWMKE